MKKLIVSLAAATLALSLASVSFADDAANTAAAATTAAAAKDAAPAADAKKVAKKHKKSCKHCHCKDKKETAKQDKEAAPAQLDTATQQAAS